MLAVGPRLRGDPGWWKSWIQAVGSSRKRSVAHRPAGNEPVREVIEAVVAGGVVASAGGVHECLCGTTSRRWRCPGSRGSWRSTQWQAASRDDVPVDACLQVVDVFDAGGGVLGFVRPSEAFRRRSPRAAVSRSRACRIFWENVHWSHSGSLAMSMTASPNAVIRSLVNKGHVIVGGGVIRHGPVSASG